MCKVQAVSYQITNGADPRFAELCRQLDIFLNELVGGEHNRSAYIPYNALTDIHDVVLACDADRPVGCAGLRVYTGACAEVKRVFVHPAYRGRGIAKALMARLERMAKTQGYTRLVLETGAPLVAAMGLYRAAGYRVIPNYGPYAGMPASVCMEKRLSGPACVRPGV